MKALLIPARYQSSRFPAKPLAHILGVPMILRTVSQAFQAKGFDFYGVVTDHDEIFHTVTSAGYNCLMTPKNCLTGSDRLFLAAKEIGADFIVNCQGDEPTIDPKEIETFINFCDTKGQGWYTGHTSLSQVKWNEYNSVKIKVSTSGKVEDFQRVLNQSRINSNWYRHIGIYGYSFSELEIFAQRLQTEAELKLSLEQLRVFPKRPFYSVKLNEPGLSVDVPQDIVEVEKFLSH